MIERIECAGVEGIRVGRFVRQINTTCIVYRMGSTVIDTGPRNQWKHVRRFLAERQVQQVLVTHHHEDHSGNLAAVVNEQGGKAYAPTDGVAPLARGFFLHPYQHVIWGRPTRIAVEPLPDRIVVEPGSTLVPLPAPGHSVDMTCFLEPERGWLFTGDLYIAAKIRYQRRDEDVGGQVDSLRRILTHEFQTVFCAHRGIVRDGRTALRDKLDFLESLCQRVSHLRSQGRSVKEITRQLLGREVLLSLMTGFQFCKRNLIASCVAAADRECPENRC